jgi:hypothetical protein
MLGDGVEPLSESNAIYRSMKSMSEQIGSILMGSWIIIDGSSVTLLAKKNGFLLKKMV